MLGVQALNFILYVIGGYGNVDTCGEWTSRNQPLVVLLVCILDLNLKRSNLPSWRVDLCSCQWPYTQRCLCCVFTLLRWTAAVL
jgi:hypothetical protein